MSVTGDDQSDTVYLVSVTGDDQSDTVYLVSVTGDDQSDTVYLVSERDTTEANQHKPNAVWPINTNQTPCGQSIQTKQHVASVITITEAQ